MTFGARQDGDQRTLISYCLLPYKYDKWYWIEKIEFKQEWSFLWGWWCIGIIHHKRNGAKVILK